VIVVWAVAMVAGVVGAALSSRRAVGAALDIADGLGVSKGLIGVTLVAVGTDLPEIANSIIASVSGHGDVNVGDSTGSVLTQVTLVLAILIFATPAIASTTNRDDRTVVAPTAVATVVALLLIVWMVRDDRFGRLDGALLVAFWAVSMLFVGRSHQSELDLGRDSASRARRSVLPMMGWLAVVGAAATVAVQSFVRVAETIGVPELFASTVVLALGTSFPELVVDWTAIRRGAVALAFGDLFGSSLVDATLSIGIGPVIRPTAVSSEASASVLLIAVGIAVTTVVVLVHHDRGRRLATELVVVYAATLGSIAVITG
jgi:cation:H+ antiporter